MATLASTKVTAQGFNSPYPTSGPFLMTIYRVALNTAGDTATITAADAGGRFVVAAVLGHAATTSLSTNGTDTQVVFTITASAATNVTSDAVLWVAT